jgi:hypothetical protein
VAITTLYSTPPVQIRHIETATALQANFDYQKIALNNSLAQARQINNFNIDGTKADPYRGATLLGKQDSPILTSCHIDATTRTLLNPCYFFSFLTPLNLPPDVLLSINLPESTFLFTQSFVLGFCNCERFLTSPLRPEPGGGFFAI